MRKVFILLIALIISGVGLYAQNVITTKYDLQSNSIVSNRMYQLKDGSVAIAAMMSYQDSLYSDRGTAYNFFDGSSWDEIPATRIEANATGEDIRTGWSSIAPYGAEGEILVNHSEGLKYWTREVAGQGVWDGPHDIPNPVGLEGQNGVDYQLSWPRIVTTGENNDVVHIIACAQNADVEKGYVANFYLRSTDLQNWDIQWSPLVQDNMHLDVYNADDYAVAANGSNIAVVYSGTYTSHAMLYKSTDNGLTWTSRIIWENPYYGLDWGTDENSLFEKLYIPVHASATIGDDGVVHVALSTALCIHESLSSILFNYSVTSDGIAYWNDSRETPIQSPYDDNPNNALRLWWPIPEYPNQMFRDTINFCAYTPFHHSHVVLDKVYHGNFDGTIRDYQYSLYGNSTYPSIAIDPEGNLAVAYSAPDIRFTKGSFYNRNLFISYKPFDNDKWYIQATGTPHEAEEAAFISAVSNSVNSNEFWFSCQSDDEPGFYCGTSQSQAEITTNNIQIHKFDASQFETVNIQARINNVEAGKVLGTGDYAKGAPVTLTALANEGFEFVNWSENGKVISTKENYLFYPENDRNNIVANFKIPTIVNDFQDILTTTYDLQSNGFISNRMYQTKDGSVAVTATMSQEYSSFTDRGTGYNFFDGENWDEMPLTRSEANATGNDLRTGWPSIAPYGAEGEILVNHSSGLNYWIREKAGEGVWDGPYAIPNPVGLEGQNGVDYQLSWPRIVTTGENNDVVHIIACAQNADVETGYVANFYLRSTDLQNWDIQWSPLVMDDMHLDTYSADDYAVSANGDNIAVVYCGGFSTHVMLYESNDAGLTWTSRIVWECPIHGLDWETDEESIFDNLYGPVHASVAIGVDGVSHVALSVGCYKHDELGTSYNLHYGLTIDGIAYWNDTTCWDVDENGVGVPSPIRSNFDDSPLNALRLWWPVPEDTNYIQRDKYNFCAWMPTPEEVGGLGGMDYTKIYTGSAGGEAGDYLVLLGGCSAYPSIAVDPAGNLAVAFSAPDPLRLYDGKYYYRSLFVTYKDADSLHWNSASTGEFYNFYHESQHTADEATYVSAVCNPVNINEFWFSCLADNSPGFYSGNYHSQSNITTSELQVFKYKHEIDFRNYIIATANPVNAGIIKGTGKYYLDKEVTITAIPKDGYAFLNWTENGEIISTDSEYTFVVEHDREFVANFIKFNAPANVNATAISTSSIAITWESGDNAMSYNIYRDNELIANVTETNYTDENLNYDTEYCYSITSVRDENESAKSEEVCTKTLGENINELSTSFNIYPNPVDNKLFIASETDIKSVSIYTITGVMIENVEYTMNYEKYTIDVSSLNGGIYFIKVKTDNYEVMNRFIKK